MPEVADIFQQFGQAFRKEYPQPSFKKKAMNAIELCRTSKLGGHVDQCSDCGHLRISYNSCRNRHCPKCQNLNKERWLENRRNDLLSITYFHVVFTFPEELNALAQRNPELLYTLLFQASAETLQELAKEPHHLGAQIGFTSILHTWGQTLVHHPHIHCIVTGGGLSLDQSKWVSSRSNFFLPVKVMSKLFRGKLLDGLKLIHSKLVGLGSDIDFKRLLNKLYNKNWVVYCKPPFHSAQHVLQYLGRYTHKVAIGNHRIEQIQDGRITFRWRDYKDQGRNKSMTLDAFEFIRRFLLHVLPSGFMKIRHYGLLSCRGKEIKLKRCRELLGTPAIPEKTILRETWSAFLTRITGTDPLRCPQCGKGVMIRDAFAPGHSPPIQMLNPAN